MADEFTNWPTTGWRRDAASLQALMDSGVRTNVSNTWTVGGQLIIEGSTYGIGVENVAAPAYTAGSYLSSFGISSYQDVASSSLEIGTWSDTYYRRFTITNQGVLQWHPTAGSHTPDLAVSRAEAKVLKIEEMEIGTWSTGFAGLWHTTQTAGTVNYAFLTASSGQTYVNCSSGQFISFRVNNSEMMSITSSAAAFSVPVVAIGADFTTSIYVDNPLTGSSTRSSNIAFRDNQATRQSYYLRKDGDALITMNNAGTVLLSVGTTAVSTGAPLSVIGAITATANGPGMTLIGTSSQYIQFYPAGVGGGRRAYVGHGTPSSDNFYVAAEGTNASIILTPTGTGAVAVSGKKIVGAAAGTTSGDVLTFDQLTNLALTGNPTAPTQAASDDSTRIATTAYVNDRLDAIPSCRIKRTGAVQTVGTSATLAVIFDGEDWDPDNFWASSPNPTRVQPTKAGVYHITAIGAIAGGSGSGGRVTRIRFGGSTIIGESQYTGAAAGGYAVNVMTASCDYKFNGTTDYVEMLLWQDSGGNLNSAIQAGLHPVLSMVWVSAG